MTSHFLRNTQQHVGFAALPTNRPWRVKLGMDPTAPDLHLGHAVLLRKMREFQDAGHEGILVVGSFTAQIGDPTGKNKTRPPLTAQEVQANAKTYIDQAFLILDPAKTTVVHNDAWLGNMNAASLVALMSKVTVAQVLTREDFSKRMQANESISMHELLYPLMQAADSVELRADIELGGSDQWFNLHMGRTLQEKSGQPAQALLTMPLLVGLDGVHKMSKSLDNHIGLKSDPIDSFGRFMSVSDETMWKMLPLLAIWSDEQIEELRTGCSNGLANPMQVKKDAGRDVLAMLHGVQAAQDAVLAFEARHQKKAAAHEPREALVQGGARSVVSIIKELGFADSMSDAGRKMEQGGVRIDGEKVLDRKAELGEGQFLIEVGKRQSCQLTLKQGAPDASLVPNL